MPSASSHQVGHPHPLMPFELAGTIDAAAHRHDVLLRRQHRVNLDQIAVADVEALRADVVEIDVERDSLLMRVDPLDLHALRVAERADSAAELDYRVERLARAPELVDRGTLHVADHSNHRPDHRHEDHVAGLQLLVALLVAGQQQSCKDRSSRTS